MSQPLLSSSNRSRTIGQWDLAGVGVSAVCVIHCVAPPLLMLMVPAAGVAWLEDPALGWAFVGVAAVIAMAALGAGVVRHRRFEALVLGVVGVVIMALGHGLAVNGEWEMVSGAVGGAALIAAHLRNRALVRAASRCQCSACAVDTGDAASAPPPVSISRGSSAVGP